MKRLIGFLSVTTLTAVLAAPLAAQTMWVNASVPFEFMLAGRSMPAGDYTVARPNSANMATIRVFGGNVNAMSLAMNYTASPKERTGQALLIFHRYGDRYFLSRIVDGSQGTGVELPISHTEKELSKTASVEKLETVAVLARR